MLFAKFFVLIPERGVLELSGPVLMMDQDGNLDEVGEDDKEAITQFKEDLRKQFLQMEGVTHVWMEEEIGTILDPVCGPNPVYGPKAEALKN